MRCCGVTELTIPQDSASLVLQALRPGLQRLRARYTAEIGSVVGVEGGYVSITPMPDGRDRDRPLCGGASFKVSVLVTMGHSTAAGVLIMQPWVKDQLTQRESLPNGQSAWLRYDRSEMLAETRDVVDTASGRHRPYAVDSYTLFIEGVGK